MRQWKIHHWALVLGLAIVALQSASLMSEVMAAHDNEELHNGAVALELLYGHLKDVFDLQARPYCGGCTVTSLTAAGLFALLPPTLYVFKLTAILFYLLMFLAGFRALWCHAGRLAAVSFGLLWLLPPFPWIRISLVSYGNHYESVLYPLVALNLVLPIALAHRQRRRSPGWWYLALGGILGFGVYTCFTAASSAVALLALSLMWLPRSPRGPLLTIVGLGIGASPWLLYWMATGVNPVTAPIYRQDDFSLGIDHLPAKLASLFSPRQVEAILGFPWIPSGRVLAWTAAVAILVAVAIAAGLARRSLQRPSLLPRPAPKDPPQHPASPNDAEGTVSPNDAQGTVSPNDAQGTVSPNDAQGTGSKEGLEVTALAALLLMGAFLAAYIIPQHFYVEHPAGGYPGPLGLRYLAPLYMSIALTAAVAVQALYHPFHGPSSTPLPSETGQIPDRGWSRPMHRKSLAILLLIGLLATGAFSRLVVFTLWPISTMAWSKLGADYPFFRPPGAWQLGEDSHRRCTTRSPRSRAFHQWSLGWGETHRLLNSFATRGLTHPLQDRTELRHVQTQLAALTPEQPEQARAWHEGMAWALRDSLLHPESTVASFMRDLAIYCALLPADAWRTIARESLRIPDWFEQQVNQFPRDPQHVNMVKVLTPLEGLEAPQDPRGPVAWALGGVAARELVPATTNLDEGLWSMLTIAFWRLGGERWAPSWERRTLDPVAPLPDGLLEAYVQGFGEQLGRTWGTRLEDPPPPAELPPALRDAYRSAYQVGQSFYFVE